jgi:DNA repair exonuclease SbcCD ATPase subunit
MNALRIAALRPLYLLVLVAAIFGGLTITIWWLPLGLIVYGVAVWMAAQDPLLTLPPPRPRPRITSPTLRALIREIERSQKEIEQAVAGVQGPLTGILNNVVSQTRDLLEEAYYLADKGQIIERYFKANNYQKLEQQLTQLNWQISATIDPFTRQQLEERRQALLTQQKHFQDLRVYFDRIQAQLANIDASLDTILAETIRLRTADAVAMSSASGAVQQRLDDLRSDMEVFRKVLDTAMTGI